MAGIDPTKSILPKRNARLRVSDIRRIMRAMTAEGKTVSAVNIAADGTVQIVSQYSKGEKKFTHQVLPVVSSKL